jgi:hypothetical protein
MPKRITLLCNGGNPEPTLIMHELEIRGYNVDVCSLEETPTPGQDVLALLEEEQPFFENMDSTKLTKFRSFIRKLDGAGLLWLTRLSNVHCTDPRYAQVIGLFRVLRSEMGVSIATVEAEKITTPTDAVGVANVLAHFQTREEDGAMGPDYEYAIHNNDTFVNRILPFSLDQELLVSHISDEAVVTQSSPGHLNTITWSTKQESVPKGDEIEVEVYASGLNFRVGFTLARFLRL